MRPRIPITLLLVVLALPSATEELTDRERDIIDRTTDQMMEMLEKVYLRRAAPEDFDRFHLYAHCARIRLGIAVEDAAEIGFTEEVVRNAAESRLRAARLYDDGSTAAALLVSSTIFELVFSMEVQLLKPVYDLSSGLTTLTVTWESGSVGQHGEDASYVLSSLSQHLDKFIAEYLRVNEESCSTPKRATTEDVLRAIKSAREEAAASPDSP